jgi:hypothetical protein
MLQAVHAGLECCTNGIKGSQNSWRAAARSYQSDPVHPSSGSLASTMPCKYLHVFQVNQLDSLRLSIQLHYGLLNVDRLQRIYLARDRCIRRIDSWNFSMQVYIEDLCLRVHRKWYMQSNFPHLFEFLNSTCFVNYITPVSCFPDLLHIKFFILHTLIMNKSANKKKIISVVEPNMAWSIKLRNSPQVSGADFCTGLR